MRERERAIKHVKISRVVCTLHVKKKEIRINKQQENSTVNRPVSFDLWVNLSPEFKTSTYLV